MEREKAINDAFKIWSDNSVLNFVQVFDVDQSDLKISLASGNHGDGHPFDGNVGILAHAFFPPPAGGQYAGHLHFDDDENWSIDGSGIDLVTVAAHEIGHLLGLDHSEVPSALMYAYYSGIKRYLDIDDRLAIWELYGYPFTISGPSTICTQATYTIQNLPQGATVQWSASNNNVATVEDNGSNATVSKTLYGTGGNKFNCGYFNWRNKQYNF